MKAIVYAGIPIRAAISLLWFLIFFPIAAVIFAVFIPADMSDGLLEANRQVCSWVVNPQKELT